MKSSSIPRILGEFRGVEAYLKLGQGEPQPEILSRSGGIGHGAFRAELLFRRVVHSRVPRTLSGSYRLATGAEPSAHRGLWALQFVNLTRTFPIAQNSRSFIRAV